MNKIPALSWLAAAGLACLAHGGCKPGEAVPATKKLEAAVTVTLIQPSRGSISRNVSLPAVIVANQQATLCSKITGYLKRIAVDKGDEVKAGDLLAEIEAPELLADAARYQAESEIAALDYQRAAEAQAKAPDLIMRQEVDTARARAIMAKANLDRANTLLGFTKITAPFSGTITRRMVDPGAFVPAATASGAAQNAALLTLADFKTVRLQVSVPEPEVPRIRNGLAVHATVEELPGTVFAGTITRSAQALEEATRTMLVEIDLDNAGNQLRPGMFATARIAVEQHNDALVLPAEAVAFEKAGTAVYAVARSQARRMPIKTGFNDGASVEILDGLDPNQPVVAIGKMTLSNGQAVSVAESTTAVSEQPKH